MIGTCMQKVTYACISDISLILSEIVLLVGNNHPKKETLLFSLFILVLVYYCPLWVTLNLSQRSPMRSHCPRVKSALLWCICLGPCVSCS